MTYACDDYVILYNALFKQVCNIFLLLFSDLADHPHLEVQVAVVVGQVVQDQEVLVVPDRHLQAAIPVEKEAIGEEIGNTS